MGEVQGYRPDQKPSFPPNRGGERAGLLAKSIIDKIKKETQNVPEVSPVRTRNEVTEEVPQETPQPAVHSIAELRAGLQEQASAELAPLVDVKMAQLRRKILGMSYEEKIVLLEGLLLDSVREKNSLNTESSGKAVYRTESNPFASAEDYRKDVDAKIKACEKLLKEVKNIS